MCHTNALQFDPQCAKAWAGMGCLGGLGQLTKEQCFTRALGFDPESFDAWLGLASCLRGSLISWKGVYYLPSECCVEALKINPKSSTAWTQLGVLGGGRVNRKHYNSKMCYVQALTANPTSASKPWINLAKLGGDTVTIAGRAYSPKSCYVKGLEIDRNNDAAWLALATLGGGVVSGIAYSTVDCCREALTINPDLSDAWKHLQDLGGGTVNGIEYSAADCAFAANKHLSVSDRKDDETWISIAPRGCGKRVTVAENEYSEEDCYIKALGINPQSKRAWRRLADCGGGVVDGIMFSAECCKHMMHLAPVFCGNIGRLDKRIQAVIDQVQELDLRVAKQLHRSIARIAKLEAERLQQGDRIDKLEEEKQEQIRRIEQLERQKEKHGGRIYKLEYEKQQQSGRIVELESRLTDQGLQLVEMQMSLNALLNQGEEGLKVDTRSSQESVSPDVLWFTSLSCDGVVEDIKTGSEITSVSLLTTSGNDNRMISDPLEDVPLDRSETETKSKTHEDAILADEDGVPMLLTGDVLSTIDVQTALPIAASVPQHAQSEVSPRSSSTAMSEYVVAVAPPADPPSGSVPASTPTLSEETQTDRTDLAVNEMPMDSVSDGGFEVVTPSSLDMNEVTMEHRDLPRIVRLCGFTGPMPVFEMEAVIASVQNAVHVACGTPRREGPAADEALDISLNNDVDNLSWTQPPELICDGTEREVRWTGAAANPLERISFWFGSHRHKYECSLLFRGPDDAKKVRAHLVADSKHRTIQIERTWVLAAEDLAAFGPLQAVLRKKCEASGVARVVSNKLDKELHGALRKWIKETVAAGAGNLGDFYEALWAEKDFMKPRCQTFLVKETSVGGSGSVEYKISYSLRPFRMLEVWG